jgi:hypothetical protein
MGQQVLEGVYLQLFPEQFGPLGTYPGKKLNVLL